MRIEIAQNHRSVHLLDPAVREVDVVGPGGHRAVPLLVSTKVRAGVIVGDGVGVCVHLAKSRSEEEIRCQTFENEKNGGIERIQKQGQVYVYTWPRLD